MRLLYVSSYHPTLEYNDLKLFTEMGINWFSTGIYANPKNPLKQLPWMNLNITKEIDDKILSDFYQLNPSHKQYGIINLNSDFVNQFDVVLCSFSFPRQDCLDLIYSHCGNVPVCFLTYSQQFAPFELKLQKYQKDGVYLIRGSPRESTIGNYAGHDAIIRCYVDEDIHTDYVGGEKNVLSFSNDFPPRINAPNFNCYRHYYRYIKPNLPCTLYGNQSEFAGGLGTVPFDQLVSKYKTCGCYFSIGSPPATVTYNFLEAWMTGTPIVAFGPKIGNGVDLATHEVPYLVQNGIDGFWSDDTIELLNTCTTLLNNPDLCKKVGEAGRNKCKQIFSKKVVKEQWLTFFREKGWYK